MRESYDGRVSVLQSLDGRVQVVDPSRNPRGVVRRSYIAVPIISREGVA